MSRVSINGFRQLVYAYAFTLRWFFIFQRRSLFVFLPFFNPPFRWASFTSCTLLHFRPTETDWEKRNLLLILLHFFLLLLRWYEEEKSKAINRTVSVINRHTYAIKGRPRPDAMSAIIVVAHIFNGTHGNEFFWQGTTTERTNQRNNNNKNTHTHQTKNLLHWSINYYNEWSQRVNLDMCMCLNECRLDETHQSGRETEINERRRSDSKKKNPHATIISYSGFEARAQSTSCQRGRQGKERKTPVAPIISSSSKVLYENGADTLLTNRISYFESKCWALVIGYKSLIRTLLHSLCCCYSCCYKQQLIFNSRLLTHKNKIIGDFIFV